MPRRGSPRVGAGLASVQLESAAGNGAVREVQDARHPAPRARGGGQRAAQTLAGQRPGLPAGDDRQDAGSVQPHPTGCQPVMGQLAGADGRLGAGSETDRGRAVPRRARAQGSRSAARQAGFVRRSRAGVPGLRQRTGPVGAGPRAGAEDARPGGGAAGPTPRAHRGRGPAAPADRPLRSRADRLRRLDRTGPPVTAFRSDRRSGRSGGQPAETRQVGRTPG